MNLINQKNDIYSGNPGGKLISESEKIIDIIRKYKAKILKVNDLCIEGEVPYSSFSRLRRELGFRKVVFSVSGESAFKETSKNWRSDDIEEVGIGPQNDYSVNAKRSAEKYIRFRVYK